MTQHLKCDNSVTL